MSEPVKSVEIEDVLSSIRRLVSDDHRQVVVQEDDASSPVQERLVLTDALRVPEPEDVTEPTPEASHAGLDPLILEPAHTTFDDGPVDEDVDAHRAVTAQFEDGADEEPQDFAAVTDDVEMSSVEQNPEEDLAAEEQGFDAAAPVQDANPDVPWRDPETTLYQAAEFATIRTVEVEAQVEEDIRPLGEKIAALEEVIGRTEDQWEPDGTGTDDYAGTPVDALEWEETDEDAQADSITIDAAPVVEDELDETVDDLDDDAIAEATLDEDALRTLVADIVREELQGVLGERITRNVRKLVRREIQRALALKELD